MAFVFRPTLMFRLWQFLSLITFICTIAFIAVKAFGNCPEWPWWWVCAPIGAMVFCNLMCRIIVKYHYARYMGRMVNSLLNDTGSPGLLDGLGAVDGTLWLVGVHLDEPRLNELVNSLSPDGLPSVWLIGLAVVLGHELHDWRYADES